MRGKDNRVVGTFGDERGSIGRVGYGGGSNEFVVGLCVDRVGDDIAEMIATGRYEGGRPITQAEALPAPGSVTPSREESPSTRPSRQEGPRSRITLGRQFDFGVAEFAPVGRRDEDLYFVRFACGCVGVVARGRMLRRAGGVALVCAHVAAD